jgi:CHAT domain-containing protein
LNLPKIGLISYFTTSDTTLIFLVKRDLDAPSVFEAKDKDGKPITVDHLRLCAQRLVVDFHGLSYEWENSANAGIIADCLKLIPEINRPSLRESFGDAFYPSGNLLDPLYKFELTYLDDLSEALLPAKLRNQISDCDILCFAPYGPLHSLPLHALRLGKSEEYIIERFGVCYTPSASVLRYCQAKNKLRKPELKHKPERAIAACVGAVENDPGDFADDIDLLMCKFKGANFQTLQDLSATKYNVSSSVNDKDIIHFACHGRFSSSRTDPLEESGLMLSDGKLNRSLKEFDQTSPQERAKFFLTAREIFNVQLNADLVTLRACSSGRAEVLAGDELMGLSRAFLYAGTPSLIVTLWDVSISSSYILLKEFYRLWLDESHPLPKWKALQQAQLSLLKNKDINEEYGHPYHWAPLILIGDWI